MHCLPFAVAAVITESPTLAVLLTYTAHNTIVEPEVLKRRQSFGAND